MQAQLANDLSIDPVVAAYALFSTNFASVEMAMDFIYDQEEDSTFENGRPKFVHKFYGCLPDTPEFTEHHTQQQNVQYLNNY